MDRVIPAVDNLVETPAEPSKDITRWRGPLIYRAITLRASSIFSMRIIITA